MRTVTESKGVVSSEINLSRDLLNVILRDGNISIEVEEHWEIKK